jgi:hypothetical protein
MLYVWCIESQRIIKNYGSLCETRFRVSNETRNQISYSFRKDLHLDYSLYYYYIITQTMAQRTKLVSLLSCTRIQAITPISRATAWRAYATHSDRVPPSSSGPSTAGQNATTDSTAELLRRLEAESRRQGGSTGFGGRESVGPFPLGVGPSGRRKMWRPWRELGVSGKCTSVFEDGAGLMN